MRTKRKTILNKFKEKVTKFKTAAVLAAGLALAGCGEEKVTDEYMPPVGADGGMMVIDASMDSRTPMRDASTDSSVDSSIDSSMEEDSTMPCRVPREVDRGIILLTLRENLVRPIVGVRGDRDRATVYVDKREEKGVVYVISISSNNVNIERDGKITANIVVSVKEFREDQCDEREPGSNKFICTGDFTWGDIFRGFSDECGNNEHTGENIKATLVAVVENPGTATHPVTDVNRNVRVWVMLKNPDGTPLDMSEVDIPQPSGTISYDPDQFN